MSARKPATPPAVAPKAPTHRKRQPSAPSPVSQPAIPADHAFGNIITAQRDSATVNEQALRSQLAAREGQYERDMARLQSEFKADRTSLEDQIFQQAIVIEAADAALAKLHGASNVQPIRSDVEMAA